MRFSNYQCLWHKYGLPTRTTVSKSSDIYNSYNLNSFVFACMCTHKHLLAFVTIFQGSKKKEKHRNSSICRFEHHSPKAHALFSSSLFPVLETQIRGVAQISFLICKFLTYTFVELWIFVFWFTDWVILLLLVFTV